MKNLKKILLKYLFNIFNYLLFLLLKIIINSLGFDKSSKLGGWLFASIGPLTKYKKIIKNNMRLLNLSEKKINKLIKSNFKNTGKTFFEFINIKEFSNKVKKIENIEFLNDIKKKNKSCFFVSAHYGNWEITRNYLVQFGFNLHTVYRQANNHLIDKEIQKIRTMHGAYFYKKGRESAKNMIKALKKNEHIGILIDQKDNRGKPINFFGKKAFTNTGFASLAIKYKADICALHSIREKDGNFKIVIEKPITYDEIKKLNELELTQMLYKNYIEKWIKKDPTQWLWSHKRWS